MPVQGVEGGTPFVSNIVRTPVAAPVQPAPSAGVPVGASLTQVEKAAKTAAPTDLPPEVAVQAVQSAVDIKQGLINNTTVSFVKIDGLNDGDVAYTIPVGYEEYTKEAGISDEKPAQVRYSI
jgi:hypothetical protein